MYVLPELQVDGSFEADLRDVGVVEERVGEDGNGGKEEGGQGEEDGADVGALGGTGGKDMVGLEDQRFLGYRMSIGVHLEVGDFCTFATLTRLRSSSFVSSSIACVGDKSRDAMLRAHGM